MAIRSHSDIYAECGRMSIPRGIDAPGAELVYRVHDLAPDPTTLVVVNCAGRTRSIIGCQPARERGHCERGGGAEGQHHGLGMSGQVIACAAANR